MAKVSGGRTMAHSWTSGTSPFAPGKTRPGAFMGLLGKLLPKRHAGHPDKPIQRHGTIEWIVRPSDALQVGGMPDDKTKVGEPDRSRVAADQDYEVRRLAEKHGISLERARDLIARFGNNREKLELEEEAGNSAGA